MKSLRGSLGELAPPPCSAPCGRPRTVPQPNFFHGAIEKHTRWNRKSNTVGQLEFTACCPISRSGAVRCRPGPPTRVGDKAKRAWGSGEHGGGAAMRGGHGANATGPSRESASRRGCPRGWDCEPEEAQAAYTRPRRRAPQDRRAGAPTARARDFRLRLPRPTGPHPHPRPNARALQRFQIAD